MFAQNTAEDVKKNAKEKAEITIADAKAQAEEEMTEMLKDSVNQE